MKDQYLRDIDYLRISVTDLCNLRCTYCMPKDGVKKLSHNDIMSIERIIEVIKVFASLGISKIRLTGGEPLVRKGIIDIVKGIKNIKGINLLGMTTNGILLKEYAHDLYKAGLDRINISLDTLDKDKYKKITRGGDIYKVFEGIKAVKEAGFKDIRINTVLLGKFNEDEIDDLFKFAHDNDLFLRFIELMPIGEARIFNKDNFVSNDILIDKLNDLIKVEDDGVSITYIFKDNKGKIGLISPLSHMFCSTCNRIRLTSDGKIKPCLHSSKEIDINGLENEDLIKTIKEAIFNKPKSHHLNEEDSSSLRGMSLIGG